MDQILLQLLQFQHNQQNQQNFVSSFQNLDGQLQQNLNPSQLLSQQNLYLPQLAQSNSIFSDLNLSQLIDLNNKDFSSHNDSQDSIFSDLNNIDNQDFSSYNEEI